MSDQRGILNEGFRRVWRYQRVLWFIFIVNLLLAHFGAAPAVSKVEPVTDHSLQAQRLSGMFDYGSFSELSANPEVDLFSLTGVSVDFAIVFFGVILFLTGGILEAYRSGRKLTTREFFEACGSYFWRWVRLLILMLIILIPVVMMVVGIRTLVGPLLLVPAQEKLGFWLALGGIGVVGLFLMCIRLWFDMAQVRAVVEEETGMWRNAGSAFKITFGNFGSLFWMYLRISVVGWLAFALGLWIWARMPPKQFEWTILVLELAILAGFGTRLWQRASEMVWYQRRFLAPLAAAPVTPAPIVPVPDPLLTIAPPPPLSQT